MVMQYYDPNDPASISGTLSGHNVAVTPSYSPVTNTYDYTIQYDHGLFNQLHETAIIPSVSPSVGWADINDVLIDKAAGYKPNTPMFPVDSKPEGNILTPVVNVFEKIVQAPVNALKTGFTDQAFVWIMIISMIMDMWKGRDK